jgi:hypothetical protein
MPFITKLGSVAARAYGWLASVAQAVVSSDTYFYLVSMLLPGNGTNGATNNTFLDASTNNFTVTRNGNTTQGTFTPFSQTGWSNYFDGSGDFLTVPANTALNLSSGDFTIEGWFYCTGITASSQRVIDKDGINAVTNSSYMIFINSSAVLVLSLGDGTSAGAATNYSGSAIVVNQWTHFAATKSGTTIRLFQNGVLTNTSTQGAAITDGGKPLYIAQVASGIDATAFRGFISNVRIVKGTALYTSNFVPSNVPLTTISGTSLLTCQSNRFVDNSANNFAITRNGDVAVTANSPFAPNNISPTSYSARINGASDYLSAPANTAFAFGTGNFTVEAWIYDSGTTANFAQICGASTFGVANEYLVAVDGATKKVFVQLGASGGYTSTGTYFSNTWVHLAVVRSGTTVTIYADGISIGSFTSSNSVTSTIVTTIGAASNAAAGSRFLGAISNLRVVKGTAVYTSNFTPPTVPLTAISGTSLLTCQNATFIDNSTNAFAITVSGNTQPITTNPFQAPTPSPVSYSGYFDGTGDYLTAPNNAAFNFGSGDFTLECWVYRTNDADGKAILTYGWPSLSAPPFLIYWDALNNRYSFYASSASTYDIASGVIIGAAPPLNTWGHIAVTRSGNTIRCFFNGVLGSTTTSSLALFNNTTQPLTIGAGSTGVNNFFGFISNLRVVKGTAVYTSAFTPPTAPLTAISGTSLLTCQNNRFVDNSSNAFAITVNGNTQPVIPNPFGYQTPISSTAYSGYFDGSGDYLSTTYGGAIASSQAFTFEFWIFPAGNIPVNTGIDTTQVVSGFVLYGGSTANTLVISRNSVGAIFTSTITVTPNTWNHVAVSRNTSGSLRMWINGANAGVITDSGSFASGSVKYIGSQGASNYFTGYLSNYRWVVGTAVYDPTQTTITVPTSPLTAIANTSLLTCQNSTFIDNSTNAFTITANGNATTTSVNPFGYSFPTAPTSVSYSALTNGGSGYFDGTGDYLTAPDNAALDFGASDFTVELWFYPATTPNNGLFGKRANTATFGGVTVYFAGTTTAGLLVTVSGSNWEINAASSVPVVLSAWNHIAVTRSGNTWRLFINGVVGSTSTLSGTVPDNSAAFAVGAAAGDGGGPISAGFISNFRVVKGTAVYTSAFAPPTAPVTAITNTSLLLNYTNAGIADAASQNVLETVGNAQISTAQSKWGGGSMAFDGTGDYLLPANLPSSTGVLPLTLGTGDFTIEFWVYFAAGSTATRFLIDWRPSGTEGVYPTIYTTAASAIAFYVSSLNRIVGGTVSETTWTHIALCRSGTSTRLFLNGVQTGSTYTDSNNYLGPANRPIIGAAGLSLGGSALNGYIDDLRITKFARYTANFTPPTAAFPTQ